MWAVQAGTSLSSRVRGTVPNSVNVIDYDASRTDVRHVSVARWDFNQAHASFESVMQHELDFDIESLKTPLAMVS
jgi:hypothetical protein